MDDLKRYIREVPDFPKPGINFYDITTLLKDPLGAAHDGRPVRLDALARAARSTRWSASSRAASCSARRSPTA